MVKMKETMWKLKDFIFCFHVIQFLLIWTELQVEHKVILMSLNFHSDVTQHPTVPAVTKAAIHPKLFKLHSLRWKSSLPAKTWRNSQLKNSELKSWNCFRSNGFLIMEKIIIRSLVTWERWGTAPRHFPDNLSGVGFQTLHYPFPLRKLRTSSLSDEAVSRRVGTCHFSSAEGSTEKIN